MEATTTEEVTQRAASSVSEYAAAYFELAKPRVLTMVLITTLAGFYMGSDERAGLAPALRVIVVLTLRPWMTVRSLANRKPAAGIQILQSIPTTLSPASRSPPRKTWLR